MKVFVPRPQLGDLVPQFNSVTTLYGKALRLEVSAGGHRVSTEWHEVIYTLEENYQRHHIQQRVWRFGRGEETEADRRGAEFDDAVRRYRERAPQRDDHDLTDV